MKFAAGDRVYHEGHGQGDIVFASPSWKQAHAPYLVQFDSGYVQSFSDDELQPVIDIEGFSCLLDECMPATTLVTGGWL